jgi:hypothetical protein
LEKFRVVLKDAIDQNTSSRRVPIFRRSTLPLADLGELGLPRRNLSCRTIWTRRSPDRTSGWTPRISAVFAAKSVPVINVCHSIAGAAPGPGFHPEGMYEFKVDLDGDAVEEITYRIKFDERDAAGRQRMSLHRIDGIHATDPHAPGTSAAEWSNRTGRAAP